MKTVAISKRNESRMKNNKLYAENENQQRKLIDTFLSSHSLQLVTTIVYNEKILLFCVLSNHDFALVLEQDCYYDMEK